MTVDAQQKSLTLDDLIPGGKTYNQFQPERIKSPAFWADRFVFRQGDSIMSRNAAGSLIKQPVITLGKLNEALQADQKKTLKGLPAFTFSTDSKKPYAVFYNDNFILTYDFATNKIVKAIPYAQGDTAFDFNPDDTFVAVNNGNNLFIIDSEGNRTEVSTDDPGDIVWGQSVHRNEFGINKGTYWSPKGNLLAFYRMDETMVRDYPLVNVGARQGEVVNTKYPMAGMTSHEVTVGVFDPATGKTVYLQTEGPKDHYLTNIAWTPDQSRILLAELNREQNHMDLNVFDVKTGKKLKTLFSESSDKYVEPENPAMFIPGNEDRFVWMSEKDGYKHLYLYDMEGNQIRQLTSGEWVVKDIVRIDKKGEYIYYLSNETSPIEQHLYKVSVKDGKRTKLTAEPGVHYPRLNASATTFVDQYSAIDVPSKAVLVNTSNGKTNTLLESANPYQEYAMPEISVGTIKAADGVSDLYYRLTTPVDFDPNKKYPVIVYLYNGPHSQMITNSWQAAIRGWDIYMAQKGYVMFTIDGRGTDFRGRDFEQAIHKQVGVEEGKDQMKGIEFLKTLPYVDADRIGIHGWSYGGFMTTNMLLTYPETFKVGVAGGPVMDWKLYEVMYGERYMGNPETNPEGYETSCMLDKAQNLQGRLLLIHGDMDPVVVMQHSLNFLRKSVEVGVYPDFFVYPGHEHNVRGNDRVHLHEKITRYFDDYLK